MLGNYAKHFSVLLMRYAASVKSILLHRERILHAKVNSYRRILSSQSCSWKTNRCLTNCFHISSIKRYANTRHIMGELDYLPKDYDRKAPAQFYELPVRIVRFKVKNTTEVIMTNLSQEEFSASEIKKIYGMRWSIETS